MKSSIKSKKPIQWGKVILIEELFANESTINSFKENVRGSQPEITEDQLNKEVQNWVMKDNYYNKVMDEVSSAYEVDFSEEDLSEKVDLLQTAHPDTPKDQLDAMARITILKKIIYDDLAEQWNIVVTDELAKSTLDNFYKNTGNSIREYLVDREKFENIKTTMLEQIVSERILNAFKGEFSLQKNTKS